jgi:hypothetical protein
MHNNRIHLLPHCIHGCSPSKLLLLLLQRSRWTKLEQHGYWRKVIPLTGGFANAALELELEFLPNW